MSVIELDLRASLPGAGELRVLLVADDDRDAARVREAWAATARGIRLWRVRGLRELQSPRLRAWAQCVLLDLSPPEVAQTTTVESLAAAEQTALDAVRFARAIAPEVPVIALGPLDDADLALRLVRSGAEDYLPKSVLGGAVLDRVVHHAVERHNRLRELSSRALHDPLTSLPNRTLLRDRLELALSRSQRTSGHVAVLFIDLDGFKRVNDRWGHAAGDSVLVQLAGRLRSCMRPGDTVARLGGDEFVVLCEDVQGDRELAAIAARVADAVRDPIAVRGGPVELGASIGAVVAVPQEPLDQLLDRADVAMYAEKHGEPRAAQPETMA